jgi:NADH pyrophosphatase NudC (nudix superfamily)
MAEKLIMTRTEILCPNCMKKKVMQETETKCYCDNCGQQYILTAPNRLKFVN